MGGRHAVGRRRHDEVGFHDHSSAREKFRRDTEGAELRLQHRRNLVDIVFFTARYSDRGRGVKIQLDFFTHIPIIADSHSKSKHEKQLK
jgi:hypothetical protein